MLVRFIQGWVFPASNSTTLDIGSSLCCSALARAAGPNIATSDIENRLAEVGEIGAVAASYDLGAQQERSPTYGSGYALHPTVPRGSYRRGPDDADTVERVERLGNPSN